jgi:hypothetical protein
MCGPGFRFAEEFDAETYDAVRARLAPGGRIVMNVTVANDINPPPDRIAARLAGAELRICIVDEQFIEDHQIPIPGNYPPIPANAGITAAAKSASNRNLFAMASMSFMGLRGVAATKIAKAWPDGAGHLSRERWRRSNDFGKLFQSLGEDRENPL